MEFQLINRSPNPIRRVLALPTRRVSIDLFITSTDAVLTFVENWARNGQPEPIVPTRQLIRHLIDARYAFARLHQRRQARRYPANLRQVWPYVGLPIDQVSHDLAVSVSVLRRRVNEADIQWPRSSDNERILVAVQYSSLNPVLGRQQLGRRMIRIPRWLSFAGVLGAIRRRFNINIEGGEGAVNTELHVEINGMRYGPLETQAQWREVVAHNYNEHRISLLLVRVGLVAE